MGINSTEGSVDISRRIIFEIALSYYPLRLVVGLFELACAEVLEPMAIFSGSLPISVA